MAYLFGQIHYEVTPHFYSKTYLLDSKDIGFLDNRGDTEHVQWTQC